MNVFEITDKLLKEERKPNIVISGMSCSGKSFLANAIRRYYECREYTVTTLNQDDYRRNEIDIPSVWGYSIDSPDMYYGDEFYEDARSLLCFDSALTPVYDKSERKRVDTLFKWSGDINIYEGLHAISLVGNLPGYTKVYLDIDPEICFERRLELERKKPNFNMKKFCMYWEDCLMPYAEEYIFPQKKKADLIISKKSYNPPEKTERVIHFR